MGATHRCSVPPSNLPHSLVSHTDPHLLNPWLSAATAHFSLLLPRGCSYRAFSCVARPPAVWARGGLADRCHLLAVCDLAIVALLLWARFLSRQVVMTSPGAGSFLLTASPLSWVCLLGTIGACWQWRCACGVGTGRELPFNAPLGRGRRCASSVISSQHAPVRETIAASTLQTDRQTDRLGERKCLVQVADL